MSVVSHISIKEDTLMPYIMCLLQIMPTTLASTGSELGCN